jgi:hypothetical protein
MGKSGLQAAFSRAFSIEPEVRTNRVLGKAKGGQKNGVKQELARRYTHGAVGNVP